MHDCFMDKFGRLEDMKQETAVNAGQQQVATSQVTDTIAPALRNENVVGINSSLKTAGLSDEATTAITGLNSNFAGGYNDEKKVMQAGKRSMSLLE